MKKHMLITARMMMPDMRALVTEFILIGPLFSRAETHTHTSVILSYLSCRYILPVFIINCSLYNRLVIFLIGAS